MSVDKILYKTKSLSTGGRDGLTKSLDSSFEAKLSTPKELGGNGEDGTNPEQLFASGYSACFLNAVKFVLLKSGKQFDDKNSSVEAEVGIGPKGEGFGLEVSLNVNLPNLEKDEAISIINTAHQVCPYSNAVKNNIDVKINLI